MQTHIYIYHYRMRKLTFHSPEQIAALRYKDQASHQSKLLSLSLAQLQARG